MSSCFSFTWRNCWHVGCILTGLFSIIFINHYSNMVADNSEFLNHQGHRIRVLFLPDGIPFLVLMLFCSIALIIPHLVCWVLARHLMKPLGTGGTLVSTKLGLCSSTPFPQNLTPTLLIPSMANFVIHFVPLTGFYLKLISVIVVVFLLVWRVSHPRKEDHTPPNSEPSTEVGLVSVAVETVGTHPHKEDHTPPNSKPCTEVFRKVERESHHR